MHKAPPAISLRDLIVIVIVFFLTEDGSWIEKLPLRIRGLGDICEI
jgi:hypothetical protein